MGCCRQCECRNIRWDKSFCCRPHQALLRPVRTDWLDLEHKPERCERFLCVNALVPYKNTELIVRAFNGLPYELLVVGVGPEEKKLRRIARKNIRFTGFVDRGELAYLYKSSRALVFAAEEDFGMTPVEMQATGGPVIAFGRGGVLETVVASGETPTGVFFPELTTASLKRGVEEFISRQAEFTVDNCVKQAQLFSLKRFTEEFESLLFKCGVSAEKVAMKQQA